MRNNKEMWLLTLRYCKQEAVSATIWGSISISLAVLSLASNIFIHVNEYRLPINFFIVFLPFEEISVNWFFNYVFQFIVTVSASTFMFTYSPISLVLINHTCWRIDVARLNIESCKPQGDKEKDLLLWKSLIASQLKAIVESILLAHEWRNKVQDMMQSILLIDLTFLSFLFCVCVYTFSINSGSVFLLMLMVHILMTLYIYCWLGTRLTTRIHKLNDDLYNISWFLMDFKEQKDVQMILMMAQNLKGYDGVFKALNLETFQKV